MAVGDATNYFVKQSGEPVKRFIGQPDGTGYLTQAYTDLYKHRTLTVPVGNYFSTGVVNSVSSMRNTANEAIVWPFFMPEARTISEAGLYVSVAASAGQTQTLALYNPHTTNTRPGTKIATLGTVAVDSTGQKTITGLSVTIPQGIVWGYLGSVSTVGTAGSVVGGYSVCGSSNLSAGSNLAAGPTQIFLSVVPPPSTMASSTYSAPTGVPPLFSFLRSA